MSPTHPVSWLCEALLASRSGYYDWLRRKQAPGPREQENTALRQRIRDEFECSRRTYGSPRIARALGRPGSHNRVARLMREERLWARQRSKYRPRTTDSSHSEPIAPNRLLAVTPKQPNEVWATDATCVLTGEGWIYVVALIDLYSRMIVGWAMNQNLDADVAISALHMAVGRRRPRTELIVHSDRGTQFAGTAFRAALAEHRLVASMSRKANCYDNAFIESFWSSLKYEVVYHRRFATRAEARAAIFDYIECFYNRARLHSSLGYVSPVTFESSLTEQKP